MTPELAALITGPTTIIDFSIPKSLWLTSNRKPDRHIAARIVRDLQLLARTTALAARLGALPWPAAILWTVAYPKGTGWGTGDASNAQPTCKALLDGLVKAGHLPDDGPRHVRVESYTRGPNLTVAALHTITARITGMEP